MPHSHIAAATARSHAALLLHGLGANALELGRLLRHLGEQGFSVHTPELPGYAFGTPPSACQQWVDAASQALRRLQDSHETVCLVGLSMGATLGLVVAQQQRPTAAVFLSTALAYDGWAMPWYQFLAPVAAWLPFAHRYQFREVEPYGVKNEAMRATIARAFERNGVSESGSAVLPVRYLIEGQRLIRRARKGIGSVTCPALFVHAIDDETVHPRHAQWAYDHVGSEHKDLIHLGDSYHMITVDNERDTVNEETARFLKQAVNAATGRSVFELAPVQSAELRRALRQRA